MMSNTNELRKQVRAVIASVASRVYFRNFPKPGTIPYVVFDLQESQESEGRTTQRLDIDIVTSDEYSAEEMADSIQDAFDHRVVDTNKLLFHTYRNTRYPVIEEDKAIKRIHLRLDLYIYSKEE